MSRDGTHPPLLSEHEVYLRSRYPHLTRSEMQDVERVRIAEKQRALCLDYADMAGYAQGYMTTLVVDRLERLTAALERLVGEEVAS